MEDLGAVTGTRAPKPVIHPSLNAGASIIGAYEPQPGARGIDHISSPLWPAVGRKACDSSLKAD